MCVNCQTTTCNGCGDSAQTVDQVCNPIVCATEQCVESTYADCTIYRGTTLACNNVNVVTQGDSVDEALTAIVDHLCNNTIYSAKIVVTAQQMTSTFSTPIVAIPAPGVGKVIEILSVSNLLTFVTTASECSSYTLKTDTAFSHQAISPVNFLNNSANKFFSLEVPAFSNITTLVENKAVMFATDSDNILGDSILTLYVNYKIISL